MPVTGLLTHKIAYFKAVCVHTPGYTVGGGVV